jgi:hypothetical protein
LLPPAHFTRMLEVLYNGPRIWAETTAPPRQRSFTSWKNAWPDYGRSHAQDASNEPQLLLGGLRGG